MSRHPAVLPEEKTRLVLAILAGEHSTAESVGITPCAGGARLGAVDLADQLPRQGCQRIPAPPTAPG